MDHTQVSGNLLLSMTSQELNDYRFYEIMIEKLKHTYEPYQVKLYTDLRDSLVKSVEERNAKKSVD